MLWLCAYFLFLCLSPSRQILSPFAQALPMPQETSDACESNTEKGGWRASQTKHFWDSKIKNLPVLCEKTIFTKFEDPSIQCHPCVFCGTLLSYCVKSHLRPFRGYMAFLTFHTWAFFPFSNTNPTCWPVCVFILTVRIKGSIQAISRQRFLTQPFNTGYHFHFHLRDIIKFFICLLPTWR